MRNWNKKTLLLKQGYGHRESLIFADKIAKNEYVNICILIDRQTF